MKNMNVRFGIAVALCVGMAMPMYANDHALDGQRKPQSGLSRALGTAQKSLQAAKYGLFVVGGAAVVGASSYYLIYKHMRKRTAEGADAGDRAGQIFAGGVFDLAGLALMSYGLRGWKRMADGVDETEKDHLEKQVVDASKQVVDATKKGVRLGVRFAGYSFLTAFGGICSLFGGVFARRCWVHEGNERSMKDGITSVGGFTLGIPAIVLGVRGLVKTYKSMREKKKTETKEIAIQTDGEAVVHGE